MMTHNFHFRSTILLVLLTFSSADLLTCSDSKEFSIWFDGKKNFCNEIDKASIVCTWSNVREKCPNACALCETTVTKPPSPSSSCIDSDSYIWVSSGNKKLCREVDATDDLCDWNIFKEKCPNACDVCNKNPSVTPPTQKCEDKEGKVSMGSGIGPKTCKWLATSDVKSTRCKHWNTVIDHCYKTCNKCAGSTISPVDSPIISPTPYPTKVPTRSPPTSVSTNSPTQICEDKEGKVSMGSGIGPKTCKWLATSDIKSTRCSTWNTVIDHCYKTCTTCAGSTAAPNPTKVPTRSPTSFPTSLGPTSAPLCEDKTNLFDIDKKDTDVSCASLFASLSKEKDIKKICNKSKIVMTNCFKTCSSCSTLSPTSVTTKTPSKSPIISTNSPTQICEDKEGKVSMGSGIGQQTCKWLATSDVKSTRCSNWNTVIAHCYKTCTACAGPTAAPNPKISQSNAPSNAQICKDSNSSVDFGGKFSIKDCKWFASKPETYRTKTCTSDKTVQATCYKTCSGCAGPTAEPQPEPETPQPTVSSSPPTEQSKTAIVPTSSPIELSMSMNLELFLF